MCSLRQVLGLVSSTNCINWAWWHMGPHSGHKGLSQRPEEDGVLLCRVPPQSLGSGPLTDPELHWPSVLVSSPVALGFGASFRDQPFLYLLIYLISAGPTARSPGNPAWPAATTACRSLHPDRAGAGGALPGLPGLDPRHLLEPARKPRCKEKDI